MQDVEQRHEDPESGLRKVSAVQSSGGISTAQNGDTKRTRLSSLGEVNEDFEDSEFADTSPRRSNDIIVDIMRHRSSIVSVPALSTVVPGASRRSSMFARRFIHFNQKESRCSSISL
jgi:hypothetical protein